MRMLIDCNDLYGVEEFTQIDITPCWSAGVSSDECPPTNLTLMLVNDWREEHDCCYVGEYTMDGTWETYNKAVKNYNKIVMNALEHGFFKMSDFENFIWW